nr:hypothetical protein [Mucilaginibacter sp. X4EP1]
MTKNNNLIIRLLSIYFVGRNLIFYLVFELYYEIFLFAIICKWLINKEIYCTSKCKSVNHLMMGIAETFPIGYAIIVLITARAGRTGECIYSPDV